MNQRLIRVLLADDVPANLRAVKRLLSRHNCDVTLAHDGQEAVSVARATDFDIVLLDIQMPIMDGLKACQEIRRIPGRNNIPIIAMSARGAESDRAACHAAGMTDCLPKPIDIDALLKLIEAIRTESSLQLNSQSCEPQKRSAILDLDDTMRRVQGEQAIFALFVKQFEDKSDSLHQEIEQFAEQDNWEALSHAAHKLRGIAANLGAKQLQSISADIERAAEMQQHASVAKLVDQLPLAINKVSQAVKDIAG